MFLEERDGEIIESNKYPSITLVDFHQAYYKTNYVTRKEKRISVDLSILDLCLREAVDGRYGKDANRVLRVRLQMSVR